jgi:hypothetical protein
MAARAHHQQTIRIVVPPSGSSPQMPVTSGPAKEPAITARATATRGRCGRGSVRSRPRIQTRPAVPRRSIAPVRSASHSTPRTATSQTRSTAP